MSKEHLWTDAKIKALTVLAANTVDPQARWMHEQIAKDMRNDYERALAFRNEDIGRLQVELKNALARIAELEAAQQWQPCNNDTGAIIDSVDDSIRITTWGYGARFKVTWPDDYSDDDKTGFVTVDLPDDIRLCRKIQPAAE